MATDSGTPASHMDDQRQDTRASKRNGSSCVMVLPAIQPEPQDQPAKPQNGDGHWYIRSRDPASLHLGEGCLGPPYQHMWDTSSTRTAH